MSESPSGIQDGSAPDFSWPDRIAELLSGWVSTQWEKLLRYLATGLPDRRLPCILLRAALWSCAAYMGLVWVCLCYIRFPVSPFGFWEIVKWAATIIALAFGAIYTVYVGGATIVLLLSQLLLITVYFAFSLCCLCWVLPGAVRRRSPWLKRYSSVMLTGLVASLALATFVDGSYRFWDRPFEILSWTKLFLVSASAWAALFCHFVRARAMESATPRTVVKWTVGLAIGFGLVAFWAAGGQKTEHFLRKNVVEHPKEPSAWLDLAWHYHDEGEKLAAESGDEDHAPPDPTPSYRKSLDCLNQAVNLGAGGFEVQLARAELADELGERQEAVSFGREALNLTPASSDASVSEEEDRLKWLREMIARNAAAPQDSGVEANRQERVRDGRRDALPGMVRWVFDLL